MNPDKVYDCENLSEDDKKEIMQWAKGFSPERHKEHNDSQLKRHRKLVFEYRSKLDNIQSLSEFDEVMANLSRCIDFLTVIAYQYKKVPNQNFEELDKLYMNDVTELRDLAKQIWESRKDERRIWETKRDITKQSTQILPKELQTKEAKALFQWAIGAGFVEVDGGLYKWNGETKQQLAYFAEKASDRLGLSTKLDSNGKATINWKVFEKAFNVSNLKGAKQDWMKANTKFTPNGYEKIDAIFE